MMMSAMNNNVEELKQKNLVLSKKANEAEDWKQGYKIMKNKVSCSFMKGIFYFKLSKVSVTLQDKQVETIALSQNLSTVKTTNMALKDHVKDLEKDNCALD